MGFGTEDAHEDQGIHELCVCQLHPSSLLDLFTYLVGMRCRNEQYRTLGWDSP